MDELAGLSEEARKPALDRFRLIRPHLEESQLVKIRRAILAVQKRLEGTQC